MRQKALAGASPLTPITPTSDDLCDDIAPRTGSASAHRSAREASTLMFHAQPPQLQARLHSKCHNSAPCNFEFPGCRFLRPKFLVPEPFTSGVLSAGGAPP